MTVTCKHCGHAVSAHDSFGCGKFLPKSYGPKICDCDWTRNQLEAP